MDRENRRLEQRLEIVGDPNVCERIIALHSFSIRNEKIDQVCKLTMNDSFSLFFCWFILNIKVHDIIMCLNWILKTNSLIPGEVKLWSWYMVNLYHGKLENKHKFPTTVYHFLNWNLAVPT